MNCEQELQKKFKVPHLIGEQSNNLCWKLRDLKETILFGEDLIREFPDTKLFLLKGPLGAGKTSLVKGIAKGLGIQEPITSPTFSLSQHYPLGQPPLIHIDLYRLESPEMANELFLQEEEALTLGGIMVIEWPERLSLNLSEGLIAKLSYTETDERLIQLIPPHNKR